MTCLREQQQQRGQQAQVGLGPSTHLFLFFTQSGVDARATAARVYPCTWTVGDLSPATVCTDASTTYHVQNIVSFKFSWQLAK